jgi:hypothetical protein
MDRIVKLSSKLKKIFTALTFLPPILALGLWICLEQFPALGQESLSQTTIFTKQNFSISLAFLGFSLFVPLFIVQTYWFWQLKVLLHHFSEGRIFTSQNSKYVHRTAVAFLGLTFLSILIDIALAIILSVNNHMMYRLLFVTVGILQISNILTGLVLIVIAWVMDEAHRLQEEVDSII